MKFTNVNAVETVVMLFALSLALPGCALFGKSEVPTWPTQSTLPQPVLDDASTGWSTNLAMPSLRLGACASPTGVVSGRSCVSGKTDVSTAVPVKELGAGRYQDFSRYLGVAFEGRVKAIAGEAEANVVYDKFQLVRQWSRWKTSAYHPARKEKPDGAYVDQIRMGVGVRMVLDVVLKRTAAGANLSFGFGSVSTALTSRDTTVEVSFSSIGITDSVLPERSPVAVSSPSEFGEVSRLFYDMIVKLNTKLGAMHSESVSAGFLAYHVANRPANPPSTMRTAIAAGYVWGLRAISNGKTCHDALVDARAAFPGIKPQVNYFEIGLAEVYGAFAAIPRCSTDPVGQLASAAASRELAEWDSQKRVMGAEARE